MLLMKEEKTTENNVFEEINEQTIRTNDSTQYYDLKDWENAVYEGTKRALDEHEKELQEKELEKKEEEERIQKSMNESSTPSPSPSPIKVEVNNFPQTQNVDFNLDYATLTDAIYRANSGESDIVEFSTSSDATLYTVAPSGRVSSATAQTALYVLEIRNIVLLFCLMWLVIYIISMIKRVAKKHGKGE